jgi:poly(A) polymerase Pap1
MFKPKKRKGGEKMYKIENISVCEGKVSMYVIKELEGINFNHKKMVNNNVPNYRSKNDGSSVYFFEEWKGFPVTTDKKEIRKNVRVLINELKKKVEAFDEELNQAVEAEKLVEAILKEEVDLLN